jgi:hypothetical protein
MSKSSKKEKELQKESFAYGALTVADMIAALSKLPQDAVLIYSHDDEGNEYQVVGYEPSILKVQDQEYGRGLELADSDDENVVTCVCIN